MKRRTDGMNSPQGNRNKHRNTTATHVNSTFRNIAVVMEKAVSQ